MAEVYKSTDEVLGRTVAVKVMLPQYASDPTFAARFKQEAQSAANLQSPYIVNIYDWGQDSVDGTYYIVMEYVRGTDLKTAIQQRGAINQRKAAEIASQVCAALSVAHGYDIIHRDIKPHNIMVQPDGNSKVMDFGIARSSGSSMTQTGSVLGTAYYISPEQAQGRQLTAATDLYSLGVVLYETITGQVPFDAPDAVAVALKQVNEEPLPPTELNPDIDPELEAIVLRALEKDPLDRYATAEQMRTALNNYLAGRPIDANVDAPAAKTRVMGAALPVISSSAAQPPTNTAVMPVAGMNGQQVLSMRSAARAKEEADRKKRNRMIIIAVIATIACLAIIGGILWAVMGGGGPSKVEVPDVVGLTQTEARDKILAAGLRVGDTTIEAHDTVEEGKVIKTDPSAKTKVDPNTQIKLTVSSGPKPPDKVKVPSVLGKTADEAEDLLTKAGLNPKRGEEQFNATYPEKQVCVQSIAPNTEVDAGTTVTYNVSRGKERTSVPGITNKTESQAKEALEAQGLKLGEVTKVASDNVPKDQIISQDPTAGTMVDTGTVVNVEVSTGPEMAKIPDDIVGMSADEAESELKALGFTVKREEKTLAATAPPENVGKVSACNPKPGTEVKKGSTVTITVGVMAQTPPITTR